ncbi:thermonuclease family protein [Segeticoccus rhizosphaerae]|uniref:thermonuclease family protein n=1 Tax=Segeticoccus rhizosphaerae TaxID=1104777 RepID=UPI00126482A6|nr:thermonuclease family protein [Segeticoccus rhizosphaerae]
MSLISAGAVGVVGVGAAVVAVQPEEPGSAVAPPVVSRVIDGDTVDVKTGGVVQRVRLLNVDTPETKDPDKPVQCLGPQATEFLKRLLPEGTPVKLKYDVDRTDRYGRTLAGVFTQNGTFVNAAIARAGLGIAKYVAPNQRFLTDVKAAQQQAVAGRRGLFSQKVDCTVPGQVQQVQKQVAAAPGITSQATVAELTAAQQESSNALLAAVAVRELFDKPHTSLAWRAVDGSLKEKLAAQARSLVKEARANDRRIAKQLDTKKAKAAERRAAARAAAQRKKEAAAAARQKEEAQAEARAAAEREAQARRDAAAKPPAPAPRYTPAPETNPAPPPSTTKKEAAPPAPRSGGYDGYTGCRAYGPDGTSIDEKGRRYTKIPCP